MLKKIALLVVVLFAVLFIYAATKPDSFRVDRSIGIKAPPGKIFALVNDLRGWETWSPYEKKDPGMQRHFSGPISGKGAAYVWSGNRNVGQGRMTIIESIPSSKILIDLHFIKPFQGHNTAEFNFERRGDSTEVTWSMYGPSTYVAKLMGTLFSMDRMIGNDFETGLANLKTAAEK